LALADNHRFREFVAEELGTRLVYLGLEEDKGLRLLISIHGVPFPTVVAEHCRIWDVFLTRVDMRDSQTLVIRDGDVSKHLGFLSLMGSPL